MYQATPNARQILSKCMHLLAVQIPDQNSSPQETLASLGTLHSKFDQLRFIRKS